MKVGKRSQKMINCEVMASQQCFHDALRSAVSNTQKSHVNAIKHLAKRLSMTIGYSELGE